jgi:hypothetical protein
MANAPPTTGAAACVVTHASVACRLSEIDGRRGGGWPPTAPPLPARFLRHCDEQTVVGVHAVLAAIAQLPEPRPALDRHGVVAASCQAGRITAAKTLAAALAGGGVAVSTHVVPQCSLHSPAGAVSVALGMHGPNVGIAGGPRAVSEGLLAACSWLMAGGDDLWLVLTGFDDEPALGPCGEPVTDPVCRGVAAWLSADAAASAGGGLHIHFGFDAAAGGDRAAVDSLVSFEQALAGIAPGSSQAYACAWGATLRLTSPATGRLREAA